MEKNYKFIYGKIWIFSWKNLINFLMEKNKFVYGKDLYFIYSFLCKQAYKYLQNNIMNFGIFSDIFKYLKV